MAFIFQKIFDGNSDNGGGNGGGVKEATYTPNLDGYMSVETGAIASMDKTYHTDYIALDGYDKISVYCELSSIGYAIAFFDSAKNLLPSISIKGTSGTHIVNLTMDVPSEAAYCMLSCYHYSGVVTSYITLKPKEDTADLVTASPLKGKTIAVLGDSISSVAYTVPNYWQIIAEKTECNFLDYGVSGSCFAVRSAEHTRSFLERAADMPNTADAVLVMGGTNDANKNILLGDWASTDTTTLYGALNSLIALLRTKYAGKPIVFCTPIKMKGDGDSGFPKTMEDLKTATASTNLELWHCALAIQAKCAVHGIPVIDLYNASGIGSGQAIFFREDDGLHPSPLGECRIANMVQPVLEQQFLYTTEIEDQEEVVNLVPTSIDTDGSVFNGTGYQDGYRLNSSGVAKACTGSTVTGFIPCTSKDIVRLKGAEWIGWNNSGEWVNSYVSFYDAGFNNIENLSNSGNKNGKVTTDPATIVADGNGVTTFALTYASGFEFAYIRISAKGSGAGMFVTKNQEM